MQGHTSHVSHTSHTSLVFPGMPYKPYVPGMSPAVLDARLSIPPAHASYNIRCRPLLHVIYIVAPLHTNHQKTLSSLTPSATPTPLNLPGLPLPLHSIHTYLSPPRSTTGHSALILHPASLSSQQDLLSRLRVSSQGSHLRVSTQHLGANGSTGHPSHSSHPIIPIIPITPITPITPSHPSHLRELQHGQPIRSSE